MKNESQENKEIIESLEIDALDLLNGKMKNIAIGRLRKQISHN